MRINTNVSALTALSNLNRVQDEVSNSMQKLSSGFRINRAGDDAAGLGISNQMNADIKAMQQTSRNAEQAGSVLQIMDGATSNLQSILERMKELAAQAASDTVDSTARTKIDNEFGSLTSELDRIVATTKFQGASLLDGTFGSKTSAGGTIVQTASATNFIDGTSVTGTTVSDATKLKALTADITASITSATAVTTPAALTTGGANGLDTVSGETVSLIGSNSNLDNATGAVTISVTGGNVTMHDAGGGIADETVAFGASMDFATFGVNIASTDADASAFSTAFGANNAINYTASASTTTYSLKLTSGSTTQSVALNNTAAAQTLDFGTSFGISVSLADSQNSTLSTLISGGKDTLTQGTSKQAQFLVSSSQSYTGNDLINLDAVNLSGAQLGVDRASIDLTSGTGAQAALSVIDSAISAVGTAIGNIGAAENRIMYANQNVKTAIQNFTAAASAIKDVDMASEMTTFSKNQILSQAGTAMLAQANQLGASVLKLLQ
jgi:flagellin